MAAIQQFREDLTSQKEITQGTHFNLQHLIAAYQAYDTYFEAFGDDWVNRDLFWKQVIGYVQRQMTAYDAQIHCSGVQSVLDNPRKFSRNLKFANGKDFFPAGADSGLGFEFAVYSYYGAPRAGAGRGVGVTWPRGALEQLCREKTEALAGLRESLEQGMRYQPT